MEHETNQEHHAACRRHPCLRRNAFIGMGNGEADVERKRSAHPIAAEPISF
jgi:hypothetical protein